MDFLSLLSNKYVIGVGSSVGGVLLTLLTQRILNKSAIFTYFVRHSRVGVSTDDAVFGSVRVTWNNNTVANLYSSTIELINQSMQDFESIKIRVYTSDTVLLTERTEIVGTTHFLHWTPEYQKQLEVDPGGAPTESQFALHSSQREYFVPTMNRGQVIRFHFLNAGKTDKQPSLWLDVLHKGVKLQFRVPQNEIFGVPQPRAALVGVIIGFILIGVIIIYVKSIWIATLISLIYGFIAQVPGALLIRIWRKLRDSLGG